MANKKNGTPDETAIATATAGGEGTPAAADAGTPEKKPEGRFKITVKHKRNDRAVGDVLYADSPHTAYDWFSHGNDVVDTKTGKAAVFEG